MKTCDSCGERHPDLRRGPDDCDPGCDWDAMAGNPTTPVVSHANLEDIMDHAARIYRRYPSGGDTAELALMVINLAGVLREMIDEDPDPPTYRDTGDFHRNTSDVTGLHVLS